MIYNDRKVGSIMSNAIAIDILEYAKKLKAVGFTEEQAEVQAETLAGIIDENLATKRDMKGLETSLKRDMKELETSLKRDMKELETSLKRDIEELRRDMKGLETSLKRDMKELELRLKGELTLRFGAMMAASIAIITALVKLL